MQIHAPSQYSIHTHWYILTHTYSFFTLHHITSHYITLHYIIHLTYIQRTMQVRIHKVYIIYALDICFSIDIFHTSSSKVTYPMFSMKQFCSWGWTGLWTLLQADVVPRDVFIKVGGLWSFVVFLLMGCHLHFFFAEFQEVGMRPWSMWPLCSWHNLILWRYPLIYSHMHSYPLTSTHIHLISTSHQLTSTHINSHPLISSWCLLSKLEFHICSHNFNHFTYYASKEEASSSSRLKHAGGFLGPQECPRSYPRNW